MSEELEEKVIFPLPNKAAKFLEQILDSYPKEDFQTLKKIMSLGKVEYAEENYLMQGMPMTAAVVNTKPYTLLFGKKFMEENMQSYEDCVYILSHELTHLVLDHFAKDIRDEFDDLQLGQKAAHIIVDCQVNATVTNSLVDEKYLEFIKRFYTKDEMPYCFFRPDGIAPTEKLQKVHEKLYSIDGITNKELIESLMDWFKEKQNELDDMIKNLLGNHRDLLKDKGQGGNEDLSDLTKAVADDFLKKQEENRKEQEKRDENQYSKEGESKENDEKKDGTAAGRGGPLRKEYFKQVSETIEYNKSILNKLKKASIVNPASRIYKAIDSYTPKRSVRSVVPNFHDRRTISIFSTGRLPIFHKTPTIGSNMITPCYLDVSGSQNHVIPHMLQVVNKLKTKIGNLVYCFSTEVVPTKLHKLIKGEIQTTGGTDFNPVIRHLLDNNFRSAVILTDGEAYLDPKLSQEIVRRNVDITVGWTVKNPCKDPLQGIAKKCIFIFD